MPKGNKEIILYATLPSKWGDIVIAQSPRGLCWLGFMVSEEQGAYKGDGFTRMKKYFKGAEFVEDRGTMQIVLKRVLAACTAGQQKQIPLDLRGTEFQKIVWNALLNIPRGSVVSYGAVANDIGKPKASRAVGSAVGENPISLLIPCHRVVRGDGGLGNYGWGVALKKKILRGEGVL